MSEPQGNTVHILVVDDEPDLETLIRQRFRKQIRADVFAFHFAGDGEQALAMLEANPQIEIVLTDINMPRMDGLTLLGKLADLDHLHKSVVISAYGDMENIRTAMNRGAFDFLTKPIDFQDLDATVEKTIRELCHLRDGLEARRQLLSVEQELGVAARIQRTILPSQFPEAREVELFASMTPAQQVGGDFYDFFWVGKRKLAVLVADVAGKGVPAALFMAVSRTLIRATASTGACPSECLERVNTILEAENSSNLFVTLIYGVIDLDAGTFDYANAGHNLPYHLHGEGIATLPNQGGIVLGVLPDASYETNRIQLKPGDALLLFTDGVTEAMDEERGLYGEDRLESLLEAQRQAPMKDLIDAITADVQKFSGNASQHDDITLLAFRYHGT